MCAISVDAFELLWEEQKFEKLQGSIAFDETVTARTVVAAPNAPPGAEGHLDAARSLVEELGAHDQTIRPRLDALVEAQRSRRAREAQALRESQETDGRQGMKARLPFFALATLLSFLLSTFSVWFQAQSRGALTVRYLAEVGAVMAVGMGAVFFAGRRHFMVNRFNRQATGLVMLCVLSILANRLVAWTSVSPPAVPTVLATDLLVSVALLTLGALTMHKQIAWMAACSAFGCVAVLIFPAHALFCFLVPANGVFLLALYFGWGRFRLVQPGGDGADTKDEHRLRPW
jgi:hypothetical protein